MDPKEIDFVTKLLAIGQGWGQSFFVSCLLYLSPEDLKACRLVNTTWDKVIKEKVWGNKKARKTLEQKLSQRWNTTNPEAVELIMLESVGVLFCNDKYVFCGVRWQHQSFQPGWAMGEGLGLGGRPGICENVWQRVHCGS